MNFETASHKKYVHCDNAQVCVKNGGTDTIWCAWGSSFYDIKLAPGESTCTDVGEIDTHPSHSSEKIVAFNSSHGDYALKVQECHQMHEIK